VDRGWLQAIGGGRPLYFHCYDVAGFRAPRRGPRPCGFGMPRRAGPPEPSWRAVADPRVSEQLGRRSPVPGAGSAVPEPPPFGTARQPGSEPRRRAGRPLKRDVDRFVTTTILGRGSGRRPADPVRWRRRAWPLRRGLDAPFTTEAAQRIVAAVQAFGLQPIEPPPPIEPIREDDVGVVCWMAVLPEW